MAKNIVINARANETRAAVIEDRTLDNLFIDKNEKASIIGNIYFGRIEKILPSIQAAFVNIGISKNGFLHSSDVLEHAVISPVENKENKQQTANPDSSRSIKTIDQQLTEGAMVVVQVVKDEIGTKGVRLVTDISLPGRFLVLMPYGSGKIHLSRKIPDEESRAYIREHILPKLQVPQDMDVIVRTVASGVKPKFLTRDLENLIHVWRKIQKAKDVNQEIRCLHEELDLVRKIVRDWLDEKVEAIYVDDTAAYEKINNFIRMNFANPTVKIRLYRENMEIFDKFGITRQIEKLYNKKVWLRCGGYIVIDKTEALVAIDVNTGRNIKHSNSDETILETNMQASEEISRQLRLRNMGGIVVIDFIDMKNRNHQRDVLRTLQNHLETDKAKTKIFPFSKLGLVQMTRQRVEESWEQHYFVDCERCMGTGRLLSIPVIAEQVLSKINRFLFLHPGVNLNIRAHPDVVDLLLKNNSFQNVEKSFRIELGVLKDVSFHPETYLVIRVDTGANIIKHEN
jgi:ribonuclease G